MHLLTLILGIVLLPIVTPLKCYDCIGDTACTDNELTCPPEKSKCGALTMFSNAGASEFTIKFCASPAECVPGSVNFGNQGTEQFRTVSQCCDTDLCNNRPAHEPKDMAHNGLKCYYCNGTACDGTLHCMGDEDRCFTSQSNTKDRKVHLKGCASSVLCSQSDELHVTKALGDKFSCCEGHLCNTDVSYEKDD